MSQATLHWAKAAPWICPRFHPEPEREIAPAPLRQKEKGLSFPGIILLSFIVFHQQMIFLPMKFSMIIITHRFLFEKRQSGYNLGTKWGHPFAPKVSACKNGSRKRSPSFSIHYIRYHTQNRI